MAKWQCRITKYALECYSITAFVKYIHNIYILDECSTFSYCFNFRCLLLEYIWMDMAHINFVCFHLSHQKNYSSIPRICHNLLATQISSVTIHCTKLYSIHIKMFVACNYSSTHPFPLNILFGFSILSLVAYYILYWTKL